jgi:hypothetical protein
MESKVASSGVDLDKMNDSSQSAAERAPEYFRFAGGFALALADCDGQSLPVHTVINGVDTLESLGCRTERVFAHAIGRPVRSLAVAGRDSNPLSAFHDLRLIEDMETIVSFGGTSVALLPGNRFTFVPSLEDITI